MLPEAFSTCFESAATRLGRALEKLEWPSGGKDAPCHEVNAVFSLAHCLGHLEPQFDLYAEGNLGRRGRVDLIGSNGEIAFALEAKGWGDIGDRANSILGDISRIQSFSPTASELANNVVAVDWWSQASKRLGIILITSFRGVEVAEAWTANDEGRAIESMSAYTTPTAMALNDNGEPQAFLHLYRKLREVRAECGASLITKGDRWKDCGEGWLLWAAFLLQSNAAIELKS
ncbi:hypothetical protein [Noviluteimonas dokdonensis]|nr:hypothetical protein [Lysobacter dokdonensis]